MIRFEVTGATPEEFAEQIFRTLGVQINLYQALAPAPEQASPSGSPPKSLEMPATSGSESSSTASKVAKPATTVHSDKVDDLFMEQKTADLAPEVAGTKASSTEKKTKGPKLDDLKTRLSEVIVAATERWDQKRANAYARTLLKRMGAEKLSELEPEKYDEFMIMSALYLSGTAAE